MKTSAPKKITWLIAIIIGVLGIVGHFVAISYVSQYSFELVAIGFILLALGTLLRGL